MSKREKGTMNIHIPIPEEEKDFCRICNTKLSSSRKLAHHIRKEHGFKNLADYLSEIYMENGWPTCASKEGCSNKTKYLIGNYQFRKYCSEHATEARSEWSKNNQTFDYGWKKGLTKEDHPGIAAQAEKISGENNPWYGGSLPRHTLEAATKARIENAKMSKNKYNERCINLLHEGFIIQTKYEDYDNTTQKLSFMCIRNNHIFEKNIIQMEYHPTCPHCKTSSEQQEIMSFLDSLEVEYDINNRKIIKPQEVDLYIPKHKIGIEVNGNRWHSTKTKSELYHQQKSQSARYANVDLYHIFDDEWKNKRNTIESILRKKMSKCENVIDGRECEFEIVDYATQKVFIEENHLEMPLMTSQNFVLKYNDEIVYMIVCKKNMKSKRTENHLRLYRVCEKNDIIVKNGFEILLEKIVDNAKQNDYSGICYYEDQRFPDNIQVTGHFDKNMGESDMNVWYTNFEERIPRCNFNKTDAETEEEVANKKGYYKICGCKSNIWVMEFGDEV